MQVKIDTKEKFTVVSPLEPEMTDNLAAEWYLFCKGCLGKPVQHIVLNMSQVSQITPGGAALLIKLQQQFYEAGASFVICCLQEPVESMLEASEVMDQLNVTPTESEAWDIVQMEEIERELLDDDHPETHL